MNKPLNPSSKNKLTRSFIGMIRPLRLPSVSLLTIAASNKKFISIETQTTAAHTAKATNQIEWSKHCTLGRFGYAGGHQVKTIFTCPLVGHHAL